MSEEIQSLPIIKDVPRVPDRLLEITQALKLPWNAAYLEYFWSAISQGSSIILFERRKYKLTEYDVTVIILMSRYMGKARYIFDVSPEEFLKMRNFSNGLTYFLHGLKTTEYVKTPQELIDNLKISGVFDETIIHNYFLDENNNVALSIKKLLDLIEKISYFMKALNFDSFIKGIIARCFLEKHKHDFKIDKYKKLYKFFSNFEHIGDFTLEYLFAIENKEELNKTFNELIK